MRTLGLILLVLACASPAQATTLPLHRAERAVKREFVNRHQEHADAVFCHHATAVHIRCVVRVTVYGTCNEDWLWSATLSWDRSVWLTERDNGRTSGHCPSLEATTVAGTVTVTP